MDRWFAQEYAKEMAINIRREAQRKERRERDEEVAALRRRLDVNGTAIVQALKLRAQG